MVISFFLRTQMPTEQTSKKISKASSKVAAAVDAQAFAECMRGVVPLPPSNRHTFQLQQPKPYPQQSWCDHKVVMQESLSDAFDVSTLLQTDDRLSYAVAGLGSGVLRKLRQGHWLIQAELDLHGLRIDEARLHVGEFIRRAQRSGLRCLRIVHGKGQGSPGRQPVLKEKVLRWLVQKNEVLAFVQAMPKDGGSGALLVLLAAAKPSTVLQTRTIKGEYPG